MVQRGVHGCAAVLVVLAFVVTSPCGAQNAASGRSNAGSLVPVYSGQTGPKVKGLTFEMEFSEPSGNKYLDARETGRLRLVISNPGRVTIRGIVARVRALAEVRGVTYNDSIFVGDISPNSTRYAIFYFSAAESVPSQVMTFRIELVDGTGTSSEPQLLTFLTRAADAREGGGGGRGETTSNPETTGSP